MAKSTSRNAVLSLIDRLKGYLIITLRHPLSPVVITKYDTDGDIEPGVVEKFDDSEVVLYDMSSGTPKIIAAIKLLNNRGNQARLGFKAEPHIRILRINAIHDAAEYVEYTRFHSKKRKSAEKKLDELIKESE